jgi:hypothetical protein
MFPQKKIYSSSSSLYIMTIFGKSDTQSLVSDSIDIVKHLVRLLTQLIQHQEQTESKIHPMYPLE